MILEKINEIQDCLEEVKEEENSWNEGALSMHYDKIMVNLKFICDLLVKKDV